MTTGHGGDQRVLPGVLAPGAVEQVYVVAGLVTVEAVLLVLPP